ncbi:proteasome assembly chaperone 2 [Anopheles darlingi]|uniref:proteasome assembly chaperone 2 n=1 Tax=Anopheles darlingi TaxID=43151 RepID=UPI0020FFFA7D|nr:proteasome assembly chaperone 2 [Anopheles darlingi]
MFSFRREIDFTGYTLIVPSVSVGNVPQLAVDVIIETLKLDPVGQLWHPALIPVIGAPAFEHEPADFVSTSAELYLSEEKHLAVLQLRAPLVGNAQQRAFLEQLADFVRDRHFTEVLLLASCFAHEKSNVRTAPFSYVANEMYERADDAGSRRLTEDGGRWTKHTGGVIHGGGFGAKLLELLTERSIAGVLLFMYVSEGDNTTEGLMLARMLHTISGERLLPAGAQEFDFRWPKSWQHLFGSSHPRSLY